MGGHHTAQANDFIRYGPARVEMGPQGLSPHPASRGASNQFLTDGLNDAVCD